MEGQPKPVLQKPPGYRDPNAPPYVPPRPPAKKAMLPPAFQPERKRRSCCRACCCYTCLLFFIVILLVAVAGCFFYVWYEPKLPVFHLLSLQFPRFNITSGPDGPTLNSQAVVRVEVRNPNKVLKVNYGKTVVNLKGEGLDLGTAVLPKFTQGKKNTKVLKFTTNAKDLVLDNGTGKKLKNRFVARSLVIGTEVRTGIGVAADGWHTITLPVKVACGGLTLRDVQGGALPKCKINIFRWINL